MTDDDRLGSLLRAALPPAPDDGPSRDLWPAIVAGERTRRSWSWLDVAAWVFLAGAVFGSPGYLVALAYYL